MNALWPRDSGGADLSLNFNYERSLFNAMTARSNPFAFLTKKANGDRVRSPVLSPVDDPRNFAAIAKKDPPKDWTFSRFYEGVTSPNSPLHAFISGDVREISYCSDPFRYLLITVLQKEGVPIVWLRAEMQSNQLAIRFSTDRSKLRSGRNSDIMVTTFATLNFRPTLDLLHLVLATSALHFKWISTTIGMLHGGFGGSWVTPPPPDWLKNNLEVFETHAATIESMQHRFTIQHPNAKKISLAKPELWKNEPASLSQPPSSKQDGPEGPDSNLAGTNGKIAYIGSAPPSSEEHLRGPHPMQSPNVNGAVADVATDAEKNGGPQPRGRETNPFKVLASKPIESPTPYDPHHRSISRTRNPLSGKSDERRPVQPANPASTPIPSKQASTRIDQATSILQGGIAPPSTEALGQGSQTSPSFASPQPSPPETPNLTRRILRLGRTLIATGGYSSVWRDTLLSAASDDPDQALQVAIKVLHASFIDEETLKRKLRKRLHREMRIWAQLQHENVVRLLGHTEEPEGPGLVSISYPYGNVLGFLAKNPSVNREVICADVALGLQYLHEHTPPIIHGDLKGPNVLIDGEGRASICDFGLSIILDGGPTGYSSSNFGGSLRFLAPELLDENEESTKTVETDIYAYACTCIEILFDQAPYHQLSKEMSLMRAISMHEPPIEPSKEEVTFPLVLRILKRCWDHDRSNRPSVNSIIDTLQRCLYRSYRKNLGVHQGIGKRVRFRCLPGVEQAKLIWVDDDGLGIVVDSSTSFHRVPIYQRYHWELMDNQNLEDSEDDSNTSSSLSGKDASSLERPPYLSKWTDYSVKFRLPYSSMVLYKSYHEASSHAV